MRQLVVVDHGDLRWDDVPEPQIERDGEAIVRPLAVATCDLDVAVISGRYPMIGTAYPFGHESVAEVVEVGDAVRAVAPGDRVVVPFQISCGACDRCRAGRTGNCAAHRPMSTYGLGDMGGTAWGGHVADLVHVPHADAMLVPLPDGVGPRTAASCSDNMPDAWRTVGPPLAAWPGADVLIMAGPSGTNSIGLYAAGLAHTLGAGRVVYVDDDADRLERAARLGAEPREWANDRRIGSFPVTVDASGEQERLHCALQSTASDGICTSPSVYLDDPTMPLVAMYSRCCTFHTGRAHARRDIPAVFEAIDHGFDPDVVTTDVVAWDDAAEALANPSMKMVIERS
ncbi:MAG: alcohol dehydrogenase catalytic domain-containing protein [Actinomycetota bacterium]